MLHHTLSFPGHQYLFLIRASQTQPVFTVVVPLSEHDPTLSTARAPSIQHCIWLVSILWWSSHHLMFDMPSSRLRIRLSSFLFSTSSLISSYPGLHSKYDLKISLSPLMISSSQHLFLPLKSQFNSTLRIVVLPLHPYLLATGQRQDLASGQRQDLASDRQP